LRQKLKGLTRRKRSVWGRIAFLNGKAEEATPTARAHGEERVKRRVVHTGRNRIAPHDKGGGDGKNENRSLPSGRTQREAEDARQGRRKKGGGGKSHCKTERKVSIKKKNWGRGNEVLTRKGATISPLWKADLTRSKGHGPKGNRKKKKRRDS